MGQRRRRTAGRLAGLGIALVVAGCSGGTPEPTEAGACFLDEPRAPADMEVVDCAEATFELVAVDRLSVSGMAPWPGTLELSRIAHDQCLLAVSDYVGGDPDSAGLEVWFAHPTEDAWDSGDRQMVCGLTRSNGEPLQGSQSGVAG